MLVYARDGMKVVSVGSSLFFAELRFEALNGEQADCLDVSFASFTLSLLLLLLLSSCSCEC